MDHQHPEDSLLLAYVDGRFDAKQKAEVEKLIEQDPRARQRLFLFEQSKLPFSEAFDSHTDNSVPEEIRSTIDNWEPRSESVTPSWQLAPQIAIILLLVIGVGLGYGLSYWQPIPHSMQPETPPWLAQVASYHELYVRDTLAGPDMELVKRKHMVEKLTLALNAPLEIPDLQAQKLKFKRGQILQVNGWPLVQLAYLPEKGTPVALCITKNQAADQSFVNGISHNLRYVNWARNGISYVILGDMDTDLLLAAAENTVRQYP